MGKTYMYVNGKFVKSNEDPEPEKDLKNLENKSKDLDDSVSALKDNNLEPKQKISDLEKEIEKDRKDYEKERSSFVNERKGFEWKILDLSKKNFEERKSFELQNAKLSKQISDFEKILIIKRNNFEIERKSFENKKKELEKKNVVKLSGLTTEILKEQKVKSDLQKQFDSILEERNVLAVKVKKLEELNFKVALSEQASPDTVFQSPYSSSSTSTSISSKSCVKSNEFLKDRIRLSNLFYNSLVDNIDNQVFRKVKMVWKKKLTTEESDGNTSYKSPIVDPKSSTHVYSTTKLISLNRSNIYCTYCGNSDFVDSMYVNS
ncbi:hypothetical protein L6452_36902 [Arctium lappa]|uniref:Uncharacterized protein n=1 Tax=Arctium lappa TaxID=4217 RepID=A0ACB8Y0W5_ARCLA|nr:hypothetical protein L6452_36902 [Arctium lappa]